jgi:hypothetical protein
MLLAMDLGRLRVESEAPAILLSLRLAYFLIFYSGTS